jgi:hypothetical protein
VRPKFKPSTEKRRRRRIRRWRRREANTPDYLKTGRKIKRRGKIYRLK